jgi:hypothetical protein
MSEASNAPADADSDALETLAYYQMPARRLWKPPKPGAVAERLRGLFERKGSTSATTASPTADMAASTADVEEGRARAVEPHYPGPAAGGAFEPLSPFTIEECEEKSELSDLAYDYDPDNFVGIGQQTPMLSPSAAITAAATAAASAEATAAASAVASTAASGAATPVTAGTQAPVSSQRGSSSQRTSLHTSESHEPSTTPEIASIFVEPAQLVDTGVLDLGNAAAPLSYNVHHRYCILLLQACYWMNATVHACDSQSNH